MSKIRLDTSSVLNISFQTYAKDFTFIVNEEEFKTCRIISDLLSPIIYNIHLSDPTIDRYKINTRTRGHFNYIINLVNFDEIQVPEEEEAFVIEVIDQLGNDKITITNSNDNNELTIDNIFSRIKRHESHPNVFKNRLNQELEFISKHFFEIPEERTEDLKNFQISTLLSIFNNENLLLKNEDQLLQIVNELYSKNEEYSILYETVHFLNVSSEKMNEFLSIYKYEDMNASTWKKLCERLSCEIQNKKENEHKENKRYEDKKQKIKGIEFQPTNNNTFNGIINHLRKQSNKNIEQEIDFKSSSYVGNYVPKNVSDYDNSSSLFHSDKEKSSWISFNFKSHRIIPTDYQIRSYYAWGQNNYHPKSWVIEGSNDNKQWEIVDEENNCSYLNGKNLVHTFHMNKNNNKEFQYIRMRSTGTNWAGHDYFAFSLFEIYGTLI